MKHRLISSLALLSSLLLLSAPAAASHHTTFLGPTLRTSFSNYLTDYSAYSFAGEAGIKTDRVSGSVGLQLTDRQRLKFTGEYLWQNLHYEYISGDLNHTVGQGAVGSEYIYSFCNTWLRPEIDVSAYFSNAENELLGEKLVITPLFGAGEEELRIGGSTATGAAPGININPWWGTKVGLAFNYDHVHYRKKFGTDRNANGFGGTFRVIQALIPHVNLGAAVSIREPFNTYSANVLWNNIHFYGMWAVGLMGDYTSGKNTLQNSYNVGVIVNYFLDQHCDTCSSIDRAANSLPAWTAKPAVYMPEVLAIADSGIL